MRKSLSAALLLLALSPQTPAAAAAPPCDGKIVTIGGLNEVRPTYPIYLDVDGAFYSFRGSCIRLSGRQYRGQLKFFVRNLFSSDFQYDIGTAYIQAIRTFAVPTQQTKIKVYRGAGWMVPDGSEDRLVEGPKIPDRPVRVTLHEWNSAHLEVADATSMAKAIGIAWHAYSDADKTIFSAEDPDAWSTLETLDWTHRVVTNYLLKFQVNTEKDHESKAPFFVFTPDDVTQVDLRIRSNIGMIHADYTFLLED